MTTQREAYHEGRAAYERGDVDESPYPDNDANGLSWYDGWYDAFLEDSD
ncbi:hypothetical protein [Vibrio cidicii]